MQDGAGHTLVKGSQQGDGTVTSSYTPNGRHIMLLYGTKNINWREK